MMFYCITEMYQYRITEMCGQLWSTEIHVYSQCASEVMCHNRLWKGIKASKKKNQGLNWDCYRQWKTDWLKLCCAVHMINIIVYQAAHESWSIKFLETIQQNQIQRVCIYCRYIVSASVLGRPCVTTDSDRGSNLGILFVCPDLYYWPIHTGLLEIKI